jgi:hypothetical protein
LVLPAEIYTPFLLDTFTGTGTWINHVGELGADWSIKPQFGFHQSPASEGPNAVLNNGYVSIVGANSFGQARIASGINAGKNGYLEWEVEWNNPTEDWAEMEVAFVKAGPDVNYWWEESLMYLYFQAYNNDIHYGALEWTGGGSTDVYGYKSLRWDVNDGFGFQTPAFGVVHTYRLEANRTSLSLLINGVVQFSFPRDSRHDLTGSQVFVFLGKYARLYNIRGEFSD